MEIIRKKELEQLMLLIDSNPYGKYLISGVAGCGKSFLLNVLGKQLEERGTNVVNGAGGGWVGANRSLINQYDIRNTVNFIDGLDKVYHSSKIIEKIKNSKGCYVCTSRKNNLNIKFDYELRLESLTENQAMLLIMDYLGTFIPSNQNIIKEVFTDIDDENITPRMICTRA